MLKNIVGGIFVVFLALNVTGCALLVGATAGGAGTAFWLSGKLSDTVSAPYKTTIERAKTAYRSLKIEIEQETYRDDVTQLIGKHPDGRQVWVDVRPLTENTSKVEIRVGMKGDRSESARILARIKSYI